MKSFPYQQPPEQSPRVVLQPQSQRERVISFIKASAPTVTFERANERLRASFGWLEGSVLTLNVGQEGLLQPVEEQPVSDPAGALAGDCIMNILSFGARNPNIHLNNALIEAIGKQSGEVHADDRQAPKL